MKRLLEIKKFVLAACVAAAFALPVAAQDLQQIYNKMFAAYDAKKYEETVDLGAQALNLATTTKQKYSIRSLRALAIKQGYLNKGWTLGGNEFTDKYDAATVEKIRTGIADRLFALNYLESDPSATAEQKKLLNYVFFDLGLFYANLASRSTHDPADYASAEKYLRRAASLGIEGGGDPTYELPRALAAQGKFDDARREAARRLANSKTYAADARKIIADFDFAGEFYLGEAFLLAEAGRLKAAGKPLTDLGAAMDAHQTNLRNIAKVSNPQTALELNRQGALLFLMRQPDKSAEILERAAQNNSNTTALRWLAMVRLQQQNYPAAETLAAKILAADPSDTIGLTARGLIAATKNNLAQAEKDLTEAISLYPEAALFANAYKILAFVYQKQNKTQPMNEVLEKQKKLDALYQEMKNAKPSSVNDLLDYTPGKKN